jgi:hypothetical protein
MTTHTLAVLSVGGFATVDGCGECGATGWRLKHACPWYYSVPVPQPPRDDAYARAERAWLEGKA